MNVNEHIKGTYGTMYMVHDMKKSVQYYKDLFNMTPEEESEGWTTFNLGGHRICLHATEPGASIDGKGILIANVTNLDGLVTELKSRGVEFMNDIHQVCEGGYSADFKDPSGNQVSLFEYRG